MERHPCTQGGKGNDRKLSMFSIKYKRHKKRPNYYLRINVMVGYLVNPKVSNEKPFELISEFVKVAVTKMGSFPAN